MTDTTWTTTSACPAQPRERREFSAGSSLARFWRARVLAPLHRALDSALKAGELHALNSETLGDLGYRRY